MPKKNDPLLTGPEAAERCGIAASTWRSYVRNGYVPPADDPDDDGDRPENRRRPRWRESTVLAFAGRPKRPGTRTDLVNHGEN